MLTVSLAKAPPSCEGASLDDVPEEFRRIRVEVDRAGILEHFRNTGEIVPGVAIVTERCYLSIR